MHILKLPWLTHTAENRKFEVYSVTVSPDGSRLASGGLDGKIRIWATDTIASFAQLSSADDDLELQTASRKRQRPAADEHRDAAAQAALPAAALRRPLCSMGRHTGAVTCVRFSPSGRFLASGSDDKILLIWEKDEEASARPMAFGDAEADLEHWVARKRLVAHDNDIQDMAWAPDSSILVTVGLDRSVIIWNGNTFEKIKRYDIHQSHVKGIVFDPANKYFMTASDDRTVRIFRYHRGTGAEMTFSIEHIVTDPFRKSPLTTYFRRSSWSPDGQHIAVPNAKNGPVSSVAIINRGSWVSDISLIGHESPCEVVSFSPRLYQVAASGHRDAALSTVLATAGQDKKLAIWNTYLSRPLVIADDVCTKTITDLCWSPDGHYLYISSLDGTITVVCFEQDELGVEVPLDRNDVQLNRYGTGSEAVTLPESVEELALEEQAKRFLEKEKDSHMDRLMGVTGPEAAASATAATIAVAATPKGAVAVPSAKPMAMAATGSDKPDVQKKLASRLTAQKVTVTKSGKKRVAPMLISATSSSSSRQSQEKTRAALSSSAIQSKKMQQDLARAVISSTPYALPRLGVETAVCGLRNKFIQEAQLEESDDDDVDHIEHLMKRPKKAAARSQNRRSRQIAYPSFISRAVLLPKAVFSDLRTQPPLVVNLASNCEDPTRRSIIEVRNFNDYEDEYYSFEEDEYDSLAKMTRIISNDADGNRRFEIFEQDRVTHAVGYEDKFWCIATETGVLKVYSSNGMSLLPSIHLGSPVAVLSCSDRFIVSVTSKGLVNSWDVERRCKVLSNVSVAPALNQFSHIIDEDDKRRKSKFVKIPDILEVMLTAEDGSAMIHLDNEEVFQYSVDLKCWTKVIDPWLVVNGKYAWDDQDYRATETFQLLENRITKRVKFSQMP